MTVVVNLFVFLYLSMCVRVYSEGCKSLNIGEDNECENTDCSQNKQRFPGDALFNCTIGRRQHWEKFERNIGPFNTIVNASTVLHPPIITYIEWYLREFKGQSIPALRFNYTIPYQITDNDWEKFERNIGPFNTIVNASTVLHQPVITYIEWYLREFKGQSIPALRFNYTIPYQITDNGEPTHFLVKAVRMVWSGIKNEDVYYDDMIYSTSERYRNGYYRLFDFRNYEGTSKDKEQPRIIQYGCITGLDTCNSDKKYYILELSSISFKPQPSIYGLDYYITTFNRQGDRWEPAIVTAIYPNLCSIYVVFEQAPDNYRITEYFLNLNYLDSRVHNHTEHKMAHNKYSYTFTGLKRNLYEVEVLAVGGGICGNSTCKYTAYNVNITSSECDKYDYSELTINSNQSKDESKVNAAFIGAVGGLAFLAILGVLFYHQKCKSNKDKNTEPNPDRKRLLILYSNRNETDKDRIAKLTKFIKTYYPLYEVVSDLDVILGSPKIWYQSQISQASLVLIVCPEDWKDENGRLNKHTPIQPYFQSAWEYAVNFGKTNRKGYKWLFLLCFEFSNISDIPLDLKDRKRFRLPKEFNKFCVCLKDKSQNTCFGKLGSSKLQKKFEKDVCVSTEHPRVDEPEYYPLKNVAQPLKGKNTTPSPDCPVHGTKPNLKPCPLHGDVSYMHDIPPQYPHYWIDKDTKQVEYFQTIEEMQHQDEMPSAYQLSDHKSLHGACKFEHEPFLPHEDTNESHSTGLFPHVHVTNDLSADGNNENLDDLFEMLAEMNES